MVKIFIASIVALLAATFGPPHVQQQSPTPASASAAPQTTTLQFAYLASNPSTSALTGAPFPTAATVVQTFVHPPIITGEELTSLLTQFGRVVELLPYTAGTAGNTFITRELLTRQIERTSDSVSESLDNYLSLDGGTLTGLATFSAGFLSRASSTVAGALTVNGTLTLSNATTNFLFVSSLLSASSAAIGGAATSTFSTDGSLTVGSLLTAPNASTTLLSVYGPAYFGTTATSTFGTDGALTLSRTFDANGTSGTSTIAGGQGFTIGTSQFVLQQGSGKIGVGTSSPSNTLSVNGSAYITNALTLQGNLNLTSTQPIINLFAQNGGWQTAIDSAATIPYSDYVIADKCLNSACSSVVDQIYNNNNQNGAQSVSSIVAGGSGYAVNDTIKLNAGCTVNPTLRVTSISGGAVTGATIYAAGGYGRCLTNPTGTLSQLSTSGSGTGAQFTIVMGSNMPSLGIGQATAGVITEGKYPYAVTIYPNTIEPLFGGLNLIINGTNTGLPFAVTTAGNLITNQIDNNGAFSVLVSGSAAAPALVVGHAGDGWYKTGGAGTLSFGLSGVQQALWQMNVVTLEGSGTSHSLNLKRTDAPGVSGNTISSIRGQAYNSASTLVSFAQMQMFEDTATAGAENGRIRLLAYNAGANTAIVDIDGTNKRINLLGGIALAFNGTAGSPGNIAVSNGSSAGPSWTSAINPASIGATTPGTGAFTQFTTTGSVSIGTSTPYNRLTVWGSNTSGSTAAFLIANGASTTEFVVFNDGNATLAGALTQNSDARLKSDIQPLTASSSLAIIVALNPLSFAWTSNIFGTGEHLGFIAQDLQKLLPQLVSTTSPTALTPDGTLGINYIGLIAPIVGAIKEIASISGAFKAALMAWLADASNGIHVLYATVMHAQSVKTDELCVGATCISEPQLAAIVAAQALSAEEGGTPHASASGSAEGVATNPPEPPMIATSADTDTRTNRDPPANSAAITIPPTAGESNAATTANSDASSATAP